MKTRISTKLLTALKQHALNVRRAVILTSAKAGSVHIASALSPVDILTALYFDALNIDPKNPNDTNRDRFILSKGHGGLGLYCVLAEGGFISQKRDKKSGRVFVLLSDAECDEGSTWEAVMLAGHLKLDNLVVIIDYNKLQCYGKVKDILDLEPFADKWRANNWETVEINGHKFEEIISALKNIPIKHDRPTAIIAHTIRGKGVPFMENNLEWCYFNLKPAELDKTLAEIY